MQQEVNQDLDILVSQLSNLKEEMDRAITGGKCFIDVKLLHLQIKELNRLIEKLKQRNDRDGHLRVV